MPTIQIEAEQLLNAALQMSREELEQFVAKLFALKAREETPALSGRETQLLLQINQGVPTQLHERYNALLKKRRQDKLSRREHQELLALIKQMEHLDVERLKLLAELAQMRGLSLPDLMQQLGLKPPAPDYV